MNIYTEKTSDLIRNGEFERAWERHCGFLDLTTEEFMQIQWRLLQEQFSYATKSRLWCAMFPQMAQSADICSFRTIVPLTTYSDYEPFLADKPDDILNRPIAEWARTSGRGGQIKWVPYTREAYLQLGIGAIAADFLATAKQRGEIHIRPNEIMVTNLPSRPYFSGLTLYALNEIFDFRCIPALNVTEKMSFVERNTRIFQQAMIDGMDLLGSMTIVLVKMGEQFEHRTATNTKFSLHMLHPKLLWRGFNARMNARREGRDYILPRDLWKPKAILCGGADTTLYREKIKSYWGVYPHETYGCTEAGFLAIQAWDLQDMTFIPSTAFYEFIPESDWAAERLNGTAPTKTLLMNELEVGKRYEVVISSFYGGPFLRYRLNDLVEVTALRNDKLNINLPQFRFTGRSGDFIDLSGFAGLIDEKQIAYALAATHIGYEDWVVTKEIDQNNPLLHLYIELTPGDAAAPEQIKEKMHTYLISTNSDYADVEKMLEYIPLKVTILKPGAFACYVKRQLERGADLAHLKPRHIQPSSDAIDVLNMSPL